MELGYIKRHPWIRDAVGIAIFLFFVLIGTIFINTFIFRSFSVVGPSMENTLHTGDRLIVNRLPVTISQIRNRSYLPERGQIIVFKNPHYNLGIGDEFIVKRVIAFSGERVVLKNGTFTVFNKQHPNGLNPDINHESQIGKPTSGSVDITVPDNEVFVSGDHRQDSYSYDSRNGLGTIPLYDIIGPVSLRIYPFDKIQSY